MASIKKVGENKWEVCVFLGRRNGKVLRHYKVVNGLKSDAQTYARNKETARDLGKLEVFIEKITLKKWLERWLAAKKDSVREQTYNSYKSVIETHLDTAKFAEKTLDKIKPIQIQELYDQLTETHSPRTIHYINVILSSAMERAVALEYINRNPCKLTTRPVKQCKPFKVFNIAEASKFLEAAGRHKYHVLWVIALTLGLRPEEYQALQWIDFDEEKGTLKIQRTYYENRSERFWRFEEVKTFSSRRTLTLSASQIELLKIQRKRVKAIRAEQGENFEDHDLIFPSEHGTPLRLNNLTNRHFKAVLKSAGLETDYRMYSLRHSCATILLAQGEKVKVVSEILGHKSTAFTMDTYQHVLESMRDSASQRIEDIFFNLEEKPENLPEQITEQLAA